MGKKVLIVDDAAFMRMMIRDTLSTKGFEIVGEAETGEDGLKKYKTLHPDLVTMDVIMMGGGGLLAVKEIIKNDPQAKILMVSAMGQQSLIIEAIKAGAKGFIIKPFKAEALVEEANRILS